LFVLKVLQKYVNIVWTPLQKPIKSIKFILLPFHYLPIVSVFTKLHKFPRPIHNYIIHLISERNQRPKTPFKAFSCCLPSTPPTNSNNQIKKKKLQREFKNPKLKLSVPPWKAEMLKYLARQSLFLIWKFCPHNTFPQASPPAFCYLRLLNI